MIATAIRWRPEFPGEGVRVVVVSVFAFGAFAMLSQYTANAEPGILNRPAS